MHFTYNPIPNEDALCQGDVLDITEDIKTILSECHPYFLKEQYKYFIVLTQSCDLVRRNGKDCKSSYITLAAVRSYDDFITHKALIYKAKEINSIGILEDPDFEKFKQLLDRLYNNNESDFFFLAKDSELKFDNNMVAYLKVSFALKSELHYDKCLRAKILELSDEFKAKLGWLVGEMYSRVGTKDWEHIKKRTEFLEMISNDLKGRYIVCNKQKYNLLRKKIENEKISFENSDELEKYLDSIVIKSNYEEIIDIIQDIIEKKDNIGSEDDKAALIRRIKSNSSIKAYVK